MADISITAANVVPAAGAALENIIFGETITAGQALYQKAADLKYYKADANGADAEMSDVAGIAACGGAAGQAGRMITPGTNITIGATLVVGTIYVLSATAGGIAPAADLATGHRVTIVGVATTAAILKFAVIRSATAVP